MLEGKETFDFFPPEERKRRHTRSRAHRVLVSRLLAEYGVVEDVEIEGESLAEAPPVAVVAAPVSAPVAAAVPCEREQAAVWAHLTRRLSFSERRSAEALAATCDEASTASLGDALDWLCLALDERELAAGLALRPPDA